MENNISIESFFYEEEGLTNFLKFDELSDESRRPHSLCDDPFDPRMETSLSNENLCFSSSSNPLCSSNYLMQGPRQNQNAGGSMQNYPIRILFEALKQDQTYQSLDRQEFRSTNANASDELPSLILEGEHDTKPSNSKKKKKVQPKETKKGYRNSMLVKGPWTAEEDRLVIQLVKQFGEKNWSQIAMMLNGRVGKQCRERWRNHLRPNIKKDVWTEEEETILIEAHKILGNKWAEIGRMMPGRTENAIKNHWNATKRKRFSYDNGGNFNSHLKLKEYIKSTLSRPDSAAANIDHPPESPSLDCALKMDPPQMVPTTLDSDDHHHDDRGFDFSFDDVNMSPEGRPCNFESLLDEVGTCGSFLEESNGDELEIPKELDQDMSFAEENGMEFLEKFCRGIF